MDRRHAIKNLAVLLGGAISATTMGVLFQSFTVIEKNSQSFTALDEEILAEFADIIIPTTSSSAGAKEAGLGKFIPMMIRDCYPEQIQHVFTTGMKEMLIKCQNDFGKNFMDMTIEERQKLMNTLKDEAIATNKKPSFFLIARDLTILGYFSSEIGCTQAREYLAVPGRYDGSVEYTKDQKAWAIN